MISFLFLVLAEFNERLRQLSQSPVHSLVVGASASKGSMLLPLRAFDQAFHIRLKLPDSPGRQADCIPVS